MKALLLIMLVSWSVLVAAAGDIEGETYYLLQYSHSDSFPSQNPHQHRSIQEHHQYLADLTASGQLLLGGSVKSAGGGMMVIEADNIEAAEALASADPAVKAGILKVQVAEWQLGYSNMRFVKPRAELRQVNPTESFRIKRNDPDAPVRQDP